MLLLTMGTSGTTEKQMISSICGRNKVPGNIHRSYQSLDRKLSKRTNNGVTLSIANRLFISRIFTVLKTYTTNAQKYYGSDTERLNFASRPEQSRTRINNWIKTKTNNKIQNMLPVGVLDANTIMVLANAIYFKGTWKTKFDPKITQKRNFFVGVNDQRQIDMMYGVFDATSGENTSLACKVLQLPYSGDQLSMVLILPNDGQGLAQLERQLTFDKFKNILSGLRKQKTIIRIPKFTVETEYDLQPILKRMGMTEIFDDRVANFTNMVTPKLNRQGVYVSDARHKAYIEVNEEGSLATAATTVAVSTRSFVKRPFEFVADHPFMFLIRDNESGTILFMGKYVAP
jgi:serpin B